MQSTLNPFGVYRISKERFSDAHFQELLKILNDKRSFFGSSLFPQQAVESKTRNGAHWIVDLIENEDMRKEFGPSFEGLSVTVRRVNQGAQPSYASPCETQFNAKNWVSVPKVSGHSLKSQRAYVVNHELGHVLGEGHRRCTQPGGPAPLMLQQTKGLNGCLPNPWPMPNEIQHAHEKGFF